jgi:hypothetical protein
MVESVILADRTAERVPGFRQYTAEGLICAGCVVERYRPIVG